MRKTNTVMFTKYEPIFCPCHPNRLNLGLLEVCELQLQFYSFLFFIILTFNILTFVVELSPYSTTTITCTIWTASHHYRPPC